jgi:hypothetical protein
MLNVIMVSVVMLYVIMVSVVMLIVIMVSVVMLNVVMLSAMAPKISIYITASVFACEFKNLVQAKCRMLRLYK